MASVKLGFAFYILGECEMALKEGRPEEEKRRRREF